MFVLPSYVKARIGRGLYRTVVGARRVLGSDETDVVCTRDGIHWELDLKEALELGIYVFGAFEPIVRRTCDRLLAPGMIAIDVGANVGSHALYMGKLLRPSGRVYAFEPTRFAFDKLTRNVELNRWAKDVVVPIQAFVGDDSRELPDAIYASWDLEHLEEGHRDHAGHLKSAAGATLLTIDDFVAQMRLPRLDVIKIDVDGYEMTVIAGATDTLRRLRPTIILELCHYTQIEAGSSVLELLRALADLGYGFDSMRGAQLSDDVVAVAGLVPKRGILNVVAVPRGAPVADHRASPVRSVPRERLKPSAK
jgi:FkbM family methyltransferase